MGARVYAILGIGTFGGRLALSLAQKGVGVIAIDSDSDAIERIKLQVTQTFLVDVADVSFLTRVPMDNIDTAVVAISKFEVGVMAVSFLKQMGVPYVIARAESGIHAQILKKVGADEIINVEVEEGLRLAQRLASPDVLDTIPLSKLISLAEIVAADDMAGKSLRELDLRARFGLNVVAMRRTKIKLDEAGSPEKGEEVLLPTPGEIIRVGDILIMVGGKDSIERFRE